MRAHPLAIAAIPFILAAASLAGCPNDPIGTPGDLATAQSTYYEKLQDCEILGEGRTPSIEGFVAPGYEEVYACLLDCISAKPCSALRAALCGEDEQIYEECWARCQPPPFRCASGEEVPADFQCDGEADCNDGSDEQGCSTPSAFLCGDGTQIPGDYVCDFEPDCDDGSDEAGCPTPATFTCGSGEVLPAYYECDTEPDCSDGSDEAGCAQLQCY